MVPNSGSKFHTVATVERKYFSGPRMLKWKFRGRETEANRYGSRTINAELFKVFPNERECIKKCITVNGLVVSVVVCYTARVFVGRIYFEK